MWNKFTVVILFYLIIVAQFIYVFFSVIQKCIYFYKSNVLFANLFQGGIVYQIIINIKMLLENGIIIYIDTRKKSILMSKFTHCTPLS